MERSPAVEALLPAWQAAEFIQPTLDCLSAQTHKDFAVCVSVDQCDDETFAICERHAEFDKRFRVIQQERRLGYSGNCNFLLGQSKAEYVLFAFHDDILAPEYFEKLATALDWSFRDADDFHPPANVAKMSAGLPLDDRGKGEDLVEAQAARRRNLEQVRADLLIPGIEELADELVGRDVG